MLKELPLAEFSSLPQYDGHRRVFRWGENGRICGFIVFHRENPRRSSFGATRFWPYRRSAEALKDALLLSRTMSYKAAVAGIPCGGVKATLLATSERLTRRRQFLARYAAAVNELGGRFITGTDVGLNQNDLRLLKKLSPYFVGLNGNAAEFTALGLFYGIEVCLKETFGAETIVGRSFAVQGLGKIGGELLKLLYPKAGKIFISDVDREVLKSTKRKYQRVIVVSPPEIHRRKVDVYCPCALSHSLNRRTLPQLRCKIIAGGANNQLENEKIGELLWRRGILYAPDYVVNAGGLISVFDESKHKKYSRRRVEKKVLRIKQTLAKILAAAKIQHRAPNLVANELAERIFNKKSRE